MLIAISGTPGTGKTAVAKILARKTKFRLINTNYLVRKYKIKTSTDKKRRTKIIDTKKLASAAKKEAARGKIIFEGHLSHFVNSDATIILRTSPQELERRLKKKGWSARKIKENVEAEAIGIISSEVKRAIEVDTTRKSAKQAAALIQRILNNYHLQKKYEKKIDWTDAYKKYLTSKNYN